MRDYSNVHLAGHLMEYEIKARRNPYMNLLGIAREP